MLLDAFYVRLAIDAIWLVFIGYWIVHSFGNKQTIYRQSRVWRLLFLLGAVGGAYCIIRIGHVDAWALHPSMGTQIAGIVLCAAGVGLAIWSRRVLGGNWSGDVTLKADHVLVRRGPYRFVRHPIYSGVGLGVAGSVLALMPSLRGLIFFLFLLAALRLKSLVEEQVLSAHFPDEYPQYKRDVKALIPFVY